MAFVIGESKDGKSLIYLGGNQSDRKPGDGKGRRTICTNPIFKTRLNTNNLKKKFWLAKPVNFNDYNTTLPKLDAEGKELSYEDTHG